MEVKYCKCYNPKAEIEFDPNSWIQDRLSALNNMIKYLAELKADFVDEYIQHLVKRIKNANDSLDKKEGYYDFPADDKEFELLDKYPDLRILCREFLLLHLNPMMKSEKNPDKYIVYGLNQAKAFRRLPYHRLKALVELLGKKEAIDLHTTILTRSIEDLVKRNPPKEDITMTQRRENSIKSWCEIGMSDFSYCILDEHMTIYRFDSCFTYEALKDYNDPDIAYYASCYGADIPAFNEASIIKLRRTQTLHHSDFCDELYWDSRVHDNPEHPTKEFLDKMIEK